MLNKLARILKGIVNTARKLIQYPFNPKNGDDYVTPLKRHYLSTGASFVVTILYHLLKGTYTFVTEYLFGAVAQVFHIMQDIVLDLWRANPSYSRWAARGLATAAVVIVSGAVVVTMAALRTGVSAAVAILNVFR